MLCPFCRSLNVNVINSRIRNEGTTIWRRRECLTCGRRFSSREKIDFSYLTVTKKNGKEETFSNEKILMGMVRSFGKKPIPQERLERAVEEIIRDIHKLGQDKISTAQIGDLVLEKLRTLDLVAYLRFASVFKNFDSLDTFKKEIDKVDFKK